MYEELVKRLRYCAISDNQCSECKYHGGSPDGSKMCLDVLMEDAADAIEELSKPRWNLITTRPMDADERTEWSERLGYTMDDDEAVIYGNLPDDGQKVLVAYKWGGVGLDTFCQDEGCYFEDNGEMDGIIAWLALPEPPKEET